MTLEPSASRESFFSAPVGRYLRGRSWIFACPCEALFATFLAGRPEESDLATLAAAYAVPAASSPHAVLFDGSRVDAVDSAALGTLLELMARGVRRLTRHLTRVALVHGSGATGAVFAGYPEVLALPCPTRKFTGTAEALAWLEVGEPLREKVVALASSIDVEPPELVQLRAFLGEHLGGSVDAAARSLGLARRSLQRRLQEAGTSWQREVDRARLAAVEQLLAGKAALTEVALRVGFSSLQSFTDWFRGQTGEPPSSWRRRRRQ